MITNANLFTESYNSIKTFLEGISSLYPRSRFKGNFIHSSMPNINSKEFDGYPFIVIQSDVSESGKSFDSTSDKTFRAILKIYSNEATDVDAMCDKIYSNRSSLTDFQAVELASSPFNYDLDQKGKKIVFRNIGLILVKRI